MAHVQPHLQAPFQGVPQQHNPGPLRHTQQPGPNGVKQPLQSSQGFQNQFAGGDHLLDPQMSLWTIRKPLNAESWEDADPQQQHVPLQDLQEEVATFRRQKKSVKDILLSIKSESALKAVNELVEAENEQLWEHNPTIQWAIGSIDVKREVVKSWPDKGRKRLRGIEVILRTEPRPLADIPRGALGMQDTARMRPGAMGQDPYQSHGANAKQGGPQMPKNIQHGGPGMGNNQHGGAQQVHEQPIRVQPQGQGHGQGQGQGQGHIVQGGHIPPPPPPPGGQGHGPQGVVIPPPPPPHNGPPKQPQIVQPQQNPHQQPRGMPGAFPEPIVVPGMKHGQPHVQPIEVIDQRTLRKHKSKSSLRHDYRDDSDSDSDSDSGSSGDDSRYSSRSVEDGAYGYIERSRSRGRGHAGSNRSRSRSHIRNRSHSRNRISKSYRDKRSHRGSRSDLEPPPIGQHSSSHKTSSPHASSGALPTQQIFNIRIDNDNDKERERNKEPGRDRDSFHRDPRRSSHSISPTGFSNLQYKKTEKYTAEPMSRVSSLGGSDSGSSFVGGGSSIYSTADDSVFSEPIHQRMPSRTNSEAGAHLRSRAIPRPRHDSLTQPSFTDFHNRVGRRYPANDYPPQRPRPDYFDDHINQPHRPSFSRRHSAQVPNPFDATRYPPQRSLSYADVPLDPRESDYVYPPTQPAPQRFLTEREQSPLDLHELADAIDHIRETKRQSFSGMHRRGSVRGRMGMPMGGMAMDPDEWANPPRYERGYRYI